MDPRRLISVLETRISQITSDYGVVELSDAALPASAADSGGMLIVSGAGAGIGACCADVE